MPASLFGSLIGHATLLAALSIAALALLSFLHRGLRAQNRRLLRAIDNMSQGLCMLDKQGRIVLCNRRYIDMYKLSTAVVKPGCSLHKLIEHRKETGLFIDDVRMSKGSWTG